MEANKIVKKMQDSKVILQYPDLGSPDHIKVVSYCEVTHESLPSGASQGAYLTFLQGNGKVALVQWSSKKNYQD